MGFHTIRRGEAAIVWAINGEGRIVEGPSRFYLFRERLERLRAFNATEKQYLSVTFLDGHTENMKGPCALFRNPLIHKEVQVQNAETLTSHEVLVVYKPSPVVKEADKKGYTSIVSRRIIRGPVIHVPEADEYYHNFVWHGVSDDSKTRYTPGKDKFTKLKIVADQLYYNVSDVRTSDDALLVVKCMWFFEMVDIELMLETTHDPIGDFINSLCADVIAFVAARTYETFLQETSLLNKLETFPQLTQRAQRMGYKVTKVGYRGYNASDKLQRMCDEAIEARTSLRLKQDTELQAQEVADMKLTKEMERSSKKRELEEQEKRHTERLAQLVHEQQLSREAATKEAHLRYVKEENEERLRYFKALQDAGVDLTKYLVAQYQNPAQLIKVEQGPSGASGAPVVHFHQNI